MTIYVRTHWSLCLLLLLRYVLRTYVEEAVAVAGEIAVAYHTKGDRDTLQDGSEGKFTNEISCSHGDAETRINPYDARPFSYDAFAAKFAGKYSQRAIWKYWRDECYHVVSIKTTQPQPNDCISVPVIDFGRCDIVLSLCCNAFVCTFMCARIYAYVRTYVSPCPSGLKPLRVRSRVCSNDDLIADSDDRRSTTTSSLHS